MYRVRLDQYNEMVQTLHISRDAVKITETTIEHETEIFGV